jgi:fructan beta-fructosidase
MIATHDILLDGLDGDTLEVDVTFEPGTSREIGLMLRRGEGEGTTVGYDAAQGLLFVDPSRSGSSLWCPSFPARHEAPLCRDRTGLIRLTVLLDRSSIEVFSGDGGTVISDLFLHRLPALGLHCMSKVVSLTFVR